MQPTLYAVGDRIELKPYINLWVMGARFGTITKVTAKHLTVKLDRVTHSHRVLVAKAAEVLDVLPAQPAAAQ